MNEDDLCTFEEEYAALDPDMGGLFLNVPIPAFGQNVDIPPDAPTDNWESITDSS